MFLSRKIWLALSLLLVGLIFGFGWYLTRTPSPAELDETRQAAIGFLVRSLDQDKHVNTRYGFDGKEASATREERFAAELETATVFADESRTDSTLAAIHRENLGIILSDWYTGSEEIAYLTNGTPTMEQNGRALRLISASPLFEEEKIKAENLAAPISSWARRDFTSYWRGASTSPAESVGYGILGIGSLYLRTGNPQHKETLELLAARYRLLLDATPLRLSVRALLFSALREEDDRRGLLLSARSFESLQDKNYLSASHGLFKDATGAYYPPAEQAMIIAGLARASSVYEKTDPDSSLALRQAALLGMRGLLRLQADKPEQFAGGIASGNTIDTYATALFIEAVETLK